MNDYQYPSFLFRFPQLIRLVFLFNWMTQQRKWLVYKTIHHRLKQLPAGSLVADLGCGEGQFILPFAHRYPHIRFLAVDQLSQNITFIQAYTQHYGLQNIHTLHTGIEDLHLDEHIDFAWCVGVLQYIPDDDEAIRKIEVCKELLIYQPIQKKIETRLYKWILRTFPDYDSVNDKQRIYSEEVLLGKLNRSFSIQNTQHYYDKVRRIAHEWMSGLGNIVFHGNLLIRLFSFILLVLTYPLILLAMLIDSRTDLQSGNGLLAYCNPKK